MTNEETIDKLIQLKLPHMAAALRAQLDRAGSGLGVEECVGLMVDREWTERDNRRLGRRLKDAVAGLNKPRKFEQPGKPLIGAGRAIQHAYFFLGFGGPSTGGGGRWPARSLASRSL